jgi:phenylacetate-CoA ligase
VLGRVRNMLTLPSGDRLWPSLGGGKLTTIAPVQQYQLIQKDVENIEIKLVTKRALTDKEEQGLRKYIVGRLGYPFTLTFTYADEIPRSKGGKFEDFRSELAS